MARPDPDRTLPFPDAAAFGGWLASNHATATELWVKFYKAGSGVATISKTQAIREALCWGWIDGQLAGFDEAAFLTRFTPRRAGSLWSRVNRTHVEELQALGRMQPPGMVHVAAAKADGRWDAAYAAQSEMVVPADFLAALKGSPKAEATYGTLNRANVFAIVYRLDTAKKPETRARRMSAILEMLERGEAFH